MGGSRRWWQGGVLAVLIAGQAAGCAARGPVQEAARPSTPQPGVDGMGVVSGQGRVLVKRGGFAEAWAEEAGRCTREMALPVALPTFGLGLAFLPPVCGVMTAALPGMTTQFRAGQMRRAVTQSIAGRDLHAELRDAIAAAGQDSGRAVHVLTDEARGAEPRSDSGPFRAEAILEVTVTEIRIRDDGTVSSLSARVRLIRASDREEFGTSVVTHEPAGRASWYSTLDPALTGLATAIVDRLGPASPANGGKP